MVREADRLTVFPFLSAFTSEYWIRDDQAGRCGRKEKSIHIMQQIPKQEIMPRNQAAC